MDRHKFTILAAQMLSFIGTKSSLFQTGRYILMNHWIAKKAKSFLKISAGNLTFNMAYDYCFKNHIENREKEEWLKKGQNLSTNKFL